MTFVLLGAIGTGCGIRAVIAFLYDRPAEGIAWLAALSSCFVAWFVAIWAVIA